MKMPGLSDDEVRACAATAYGRQLVAGGKRISIGFTPERRHSIDFGKLAA
ncbi:MAG: hypothetical protein ACR2I5_14645 [Candidatus Limnocylindria bacterium]